jgi:hypothetical protein
MEVTESLLDRVPVGNLRVARAEFGALWVEAERLNGEQTGRPDADWYPAAVAVTCRWLAGAVVQDQTGRRALAPAPATRRRARACGLWQTTNRSCSLTLTSLTRRLSVMSW